ncbi:DUF4403 family protein [Nitrospira sp. BLG_2]|uniref:DUF4403 family protein n=1 Tax=Nitrospira sp. BLG_2 TaxID=3397507 RepID=UPI003B9D4426
MYALLLLAVIHRSDRSLFTTFVILLVGLMMAGCAGSRIEIPKPTDVLAPPPPPPFIEQSVVNLKVSVPISELAIAADAALPQSSGQEDSWQERSSSADQGTVSYRYWMIRGPLESKIDGHRLVTEFPNIRYRLALRFKPPEGSIFEGRCGYGTDPPKHIRLTARSSFEWTDHWTLRSHTEFAPAEFPDSCLIKGLKADVTPIVQSIVDHHLPTVAAAIDERVKSRSESRQRARKVWNMLQQPLELGPERWLILNPLGAQVSPINLDGQTIETSVNFMLKPIMQMGAVPVVEDQPPLPPLKLMPIAFDGFHLALPVIAEYGVINRRLAQRLVGQTFATSHGKSITITSANMYGSGKNLIIEVGVTGAMNGKLYVTGQPVYDQAEHMLRFERIDYTVDTQNVVVRSADSAFHQRFLARIEPETRIDLSDRLDGLRQRLSSVLTREVDAGLWLEGTVNRLEVRGIYPVPSGVEVQIVADGYLKLTLR